MFVPLVVFVPLEIRSYSYAKFIDGLTLTYQLAEKAINDRITGSIRFAEEAGNATVDGKKVDYTGYYEYNLRSTRKPRKPTLLFSTAITPMPKLMHSSRQQTSRSPAFTAASTSRIQKTTAKRSKTKRATA
jgi:hypothetical protein